MSRRHKSLIFIAIGILLGILGLSILRGPVVFDAGRTRESWLRERLCYTAIVLSRTNSDIRAHIARTGQLPASLTDIYSEEPLDAWGNVLHYEREGDGSYELISLGPDHLLGTEDDDIAEANWPESPTRCRASH